jgi:protocatechuate 3,4-dioxygenase beta subunit
MKQLIQFGLFALLFCSLTGCNGQTKSNSAISQNTGTNKKVDDGCDGCDGCEIMFVGMPKNISSVDTSAGWAEKGQKLLVTGNVYKIDGHIRGWVKTDERGTYSIYTIRPTPYLTPFWFCHASELNKSI